MFVCVCVCPGYWYQGKKCLRCIVKKPFTKICETVYLSLSYDVTENFSDPVMELTQIEIGSAQTLHGYPDS